MGRVLILMKSKIDYQSKLKHSSEHTQEINVFISFWFLSESHGAPEIMNCFMWDVSSSAKLLPVHLYLTDIDAGGDIERDLRANDTEGGESVIHS